MPPATPPTGEMIVGFARMHIGEKYILGSLAPKNNPNWKGPWDCAEFASWLAYQAASLLYGCQKNTGDPATADAFTGYWSRDANTLGRKIPLAVAAGIPGACVLRIPKAGATGHIVISDGTGGTIEAHSSKRGVIASTLADRRWDTGILVPGITYTQSSPAVVVPPPKSIIYRLVTPNMTGPVVKQIQRALALMGFHPGGIDGSFGPQMQAAVVAFQLAKGLIADGEVGPKTAKALGVTLPSS